jgi:hypothetical protein
MILRVVSSSALPGELNTSCTTGGAWDGSATSLTRSSLCTRPGRTGVKVGGDVDFTEICNRVAICSNRLYRFGHISARQRTAMEKRAAVLRRIGEYFPTHPRWKRMHLAGALRDTVQRVLAPTSPNETLVPPRATLKR